MNDLLTALALVLVLEGAFWALFPTRIRQILAMKVLSGCFSRIQPITCMKAALGVRRGKAAFSSGCKSHPAIAPAGSNRRVLSV